MTPESIRELLHNSSLDSAPIEFLETRVYNPSNPRTAMASTPVVSITLPADNSLEANYGAWKILRDLLPTTKAWPLLISRSALNTHRITDTPHLYLRLNFDKVGAASLTEPKRQSTELHRALKTHVAAWVPLAEDPPAMSENRYIEPDFLEYHTDAWRETLPIAPPPEEIRNARDVNGNPITDMESAYHWLHTWTLANVAHDQIVAAWLDYRPDWLDCSPAEPRTLVLLPNTNASSVAAIDWAFPAIENHLTFGRIIHDWQQQWGAEPVFIEGTSVGFHVNRPPSTIDEALPLAIEHAAIGPYVLDGPAISVYEYAYTLVNCNRWELVDLP